MPKHDEISSTEKLLDLIRGKDLADVEPPESEGNSSTELPRKKTRRSFRPRLLKKTVTVGVDLVNNELRLVKVRHKSDQDWVLLGYKSLPLNPKSPKEGHEFSLFMKQTLTEFCGSSGRFDLWCLLSASLVDIRHLRIPNVPRKQVATAVYWNLKKETTFDEKESLLDFQVLGTVSQDGIRKLAVMVYSAPKKEVSRLRDLFRESGFPLTGISAAPFAIQNLLRGRWINPVERTVGSIHVGKDSSRIDIFSSGNLVLSRGIKTGMDSLSDGISTYLNEAITNEILAPVMGKDGQGVQAPEPEGPVSSEQGSKVLSRLNPEAPPLSQDEPGFDLSEDKIFEIVLPALLRLVRQIDRTFEHYALKLGNDRVGRIYISGKLNEFPRLTDYITDQVGLPAGAIDPFDPGNPFLGDVTPPGSTSERALFAPSLGMALSQTTRTPNLLFTYKDKEKRASIARSNRAIFGVFIGVIAICLGIYFWQGKIEKQRKSRVTLLEKKLEQYNPRVNQSHILQLVAKAKQNAKLLKEYSRQRLGLAVIEELSRLTPRHIRLLGLTADLGQETTDGGKSHKKNLILEGLVFGKQQALEASLAAYLVKLGTCPLFSQPSLRKSRFETRDDKKALYFSADLKLP